MLCVHVMPGIERELGLASNDNASLQRMRGFADSDGHIVSSGAAADHDTYYGDGTGSGHRRKVVIDGIFNRCVHLQQVCSRHRLHSVTSRVLSMTWNMPTNYDKIWHNDAR